MNKMSRSKTVIRIDGVKRLFLWHILSKQLDLVLVTEYPKSGGTWVTQMLAEYFELPFRRNQNVRYEHAILHGHHVYNKRFNKVYYVLRDGRDVMVSYYFHLLFNNDKNSEQMVAFSRSQMPFEDFDNVQKNLSQFIEYMFTKYEKRPFHFTWSEFVNSIPEKKSVATIKYENLLTEPVLEISEALKKNGVEEIDEVRLREIVEKYSFQNLTRRKPGDENNRSFLRKGISGDWKNYFSQEAKEVFNRYGGKELIRLNYEKDISWVNNWK